MGQESFLTISPERVYDAATMGVKVAVVGGGSTYTPELVEGFIRRDDRLPVDELVLLDIDRERLDIVGALAARMVRKVGWPGRLDLTTDSVAAIEGADFVIVQLRVGGNQARHLDETIPLEFGCIGQETTGPGGFAKALRTVPVVLEFAELTAERGAPGAWFIDFTNPTGIVTQALLDHGHRAIGLCNVAIGFQRNLAAIFDVEPDRVQLDHVGLNHLTWERRVLIDGVDRLPELLNVGGDTSATVRRYLDELDGEIPLEIARALRAIPSYYLRYYYLPDRVMLELRGGRSRATEVMEIEAGLLELYKDPELDTKPPLLEERGGAFYSDAAAALVASLHAGTGDVQVVNLRNAGAIPNLPHDDVVEVAARIDAEGAHPLATDPLAPEMAGLVHHAKAYERLAIDSATSGSRATALKALLSNPLVGDYERARPLLDALLSANEHHLPRFFPG
jgi:6-phospho-beta-glucosidase